MGARANRPFLLDIADQPRVQRHAASPAFFDDAAQTQLRVAFHRAEQLRLVICATSADHRQRLHAAVEHVSGGRCRRLHVVGRRMIGLAPRGSRADHHQREIDLQVLRVDVLDFAHRQNHAVRHRGVEVAQQLAGARRRPFRVCGDVHEIPALPGGVDHAVRELGQVRRGQRRHSERDEAGAVPVEVARGDVDPVSGLLDDGFDFGAGGVGHASGAVDDIGCRFQRHAGRGGDVAQRDAPTCGRRRRAWQVLRDLALAGLAVFGLAHRVNLTRRGNSPYGNRLRRSCHTGLLTACLLRFCRLRDIVAIR